MDNQRANKHACNKKHNYHLFTGIISNVITLVALKRMETIKSSTRIILSGTTVADIFYIILFNCQYHLAQVSLFAK